MFPSKPTNDILWFRPSKKPQIVVSQSSLEMLRLSTQCFCFLRLPLEVQLEVMTYLGSVHDFINLAKAVKPEKIDYSMKVHLITDDQELYTYARHFLPVYSRRMLAQTLICPNPYIHIIHFTDFQWWDYKSLVSMTKTSYNIFCFPQSLTLESPMIRVPLGQRLLSIEDPIDLQILDHNKRNVKFAKFTNVFFPYESPQSMIVDMISRLSQVHIKASSNQKLKFNNIDVGSTDFHISCEADVKLEVSFKDCHASSNFKISGDWFYTTFESCDDSFFTHATLDYAYSSIMLFLQDNTRNDAVIQGVSLSCDKLLIKNFHKVLNCTFHVENEASIGFSSANNDVLHNSMGRPQMTATSFTHGKTSLKLYFSGAQFPRVTQCDFSQLEVLKITKSVTSDDMSPERFAFKYYSRVDTTTDYEFLNSVRRLSLVDFVEPLREEFHPDFTCLNHLEVDLSHAPLATSKLLMSYQNLSEVRFMTDHIDYIPEVISAEGVTSLTIDQCGVCLDVPEMETETKHLRSLITTFRDTTSLFLDLLFDPLSSNGCVVHKFIIFEQLQHLFLKGVDISFLTDVADPIAFPNLKTLKIHDTVEFGEVKQFNLSLYAPNLKEVELLLPTWNVGQIGQLEFPSLTSLKVKCHNIAKLSHRELRSCCSYIDGEHC